MMYPCRTDKVYTFLKAAKRTGQVVAAKHLLSWVGQDTLTSRRGGGSRSCFSESAVVEI
jgi:hypothetical protein